MVSSWVCSTTAKCTSSSNFLGTFLTTNGEHSWQRMRRASQEALNKTRATEFYPLQEKEAVMLIDGMLRNPKGWDGEFRRWV